MLAYGNVNKYLVAVMMSQTPGILILKSCTHYETLLSYRQILGARRWAIPPT